MFMGNFWGRGLFQDAVAHCKWEESGRVDGKEWWRRI